MYYYYFIKTFDWLIWFIHSFQLNIIFITIKHILPTNSAMWKKNNIV